MLVILDSQYTYGIMVQIGTHVIWKVLQMMNEQNFNKLSKAWRNTYVSTDTAGQLALDKNAENVFDLSTVRGLVTTPKEVILSLLRCRLCLVPVRLQVTLSGCV